MNSDRNDNDHHTSETDRLILVPDSPDHSSRGPAKSMINSPRHPILESPPLPSGQGSPPPRERSVSPVSMRSGSVHQRENGRKMKKNPQTTQAARKKKILSTRTTTRTGTSTMSFPKEINPWTKSKKVTTTNDGSCSTTATSLQSNEPGVFSLTIGYHSSQDPLPPTPDPSSSFHSMSPDTRVSTTLSPPQSPPMLRRRPPAPEHYPRLPGSPFSGGSMLQENSSLRPETRVDILQMRPDQMEEEITLQEGRQAVLWELSLPHPNARLLRPQVQPQYPQCFLPEFGNTEEAVSPELQAPINLWSSQQPPSSTPPRPTPSTQLPTMSLHDLFSSPPPPVVDLPPPIPTASRSSPQPSLEPPPKPRSQSHPFLATEMSSISTGKKKFRANAKGWFLTYPQSLIDKAALLRHLQALHPDNPIKWCRIARELHESGEPHVHVALEFSNKINVKAPTHFDLPNGRHGNYATLKSPVDAVEYLAKEDTDPLDFGVVPKRGDKAQGRMEIIARAVRDGARAQEIDDRFPGTYLGNKRKIDEYIEFQATQKLVKSRTPWVPVMCSVHHDALVKILAWLDLNMTMDKRPIKQKQLYIRGPGNTGKTSLISFIEERFRVWKAPVTEDWFDDYDDDAFDLAVFDEFHNTHAPVYLRQFLDGQSMKVRKRNSMINKRRNIPTVLLSNFSIEEIYKNQTDRDLLHLRVEVVRLTEAIPIKHLYWSDQPPTAAPVAQLAPNSANSVINID